MEDTDNIINVLTDFDEMGFIPTATCSNPEEYAKEWKKRLIKRILILLFETEKTARDWIIEYIRDRVDGKTIEYIRETYTDESIKLVLGLD